MAGRVVMNGPPEPGRGHWCPVCLMDAKQRQWEIYQDEIGAGHGRSAEEITVIPWPDALTRELRLGAYRAVCGDLPMLGLVDGLCWHHVAGINPSEADTGQKLLEARGSIPPGLLRRPRG